MQTQKNAEKNINDLEEVYLMTNLMRQAGKLN